MARVAPPHPGVPAARQRPESAIPGFAALTLRKRVVGSPPDSAGGTRRREDPAKQRGWPGEGGAWFVGGAKSGRGRGHRRGSQWRLRRPRPTPSGCRGRPESAVLRTSKHVRGEEPEEVGAQGSPRGSREAERGREERRGAGRWKRGLGGPPDRREPAVAGHVPGSGLVSGREAARAPSPASSGRPAPVGIPPWPHRARHPQISKHTHTPQFCGFCSSASTSNKGQPSFFFLSLFSCNSF